LVESALGSAQEITIPTDEWEKALLLSYEREMLGLYVSDHPLLGVESTLRAAVDFSISQISDESIAHDQIISIGGLITSISRKISKKGDPWAIVGIEDLEGAIEVMFFSKTYADYATSLVEDQTVIIRGRVNKREEQPRISAMELRPLDITGAPAGPIVISMDGPRCTPDVIERIKEILHAHPGKREVQLEIRESEKTMLMKLSDEFRVTATPSLSADLKQILGPECLTL
jgi:DNA polymerase-3 subunit alpha